MTENRTTPPYPDIPSPDQAIFDLYIKYWSIFGKVEVDVKVHRYLWTAFFFCGTALGFLGNVLILLATREKAILLDNITTTLIQHVAVSDILNTMLVIFPTFLTVAANRWFFGKEFCYFRAMTQVSIQTHSMLLVCALSCSKLAYILFPLRSESWRTRYAHIISFIMCLVSGLPLPISILMVQNGYVKPMFNFQSITCEFMVVGTPKRLTSVYAGINFALTIGCTVVVVGTTIWLTVIAFRLSQARGNGLKLRGVVTVICIAVLYCISFLPITAVYVVFLIEQKGFRFPEEFNRFLFTHGRTFAVHIIYLNNTANVFVYLASIASFREFVRSWLKRLFVQFGKRSRVAHEEIGSPLARYKRRATETIELTMGCAANVPEISRV